jgi:VanZ family protein
MAIRLDTRAMTWAAPLALMAVIYGLSAQESLSSGLGIWDLVLRKLAHAFLFGLLAVLWWRALRGPLPQRTALGVAATIAVLYGALDEYHQTFVLGRSGKFTDVLIDAAGVAIAVLWIRSSRAR